ncbi:MAG: hypothetical protein ACYSTR_04355 [Planctomycetota bacterium]|jgi:hypothetical protein
MEESVKNQGFVCPSLAECSFVETHREKMPELAQRIYTDYCTNGTAECARRWIYETLGAYAVPSLMLPSQTDWARQIAQEVKENNDTTTPKPAEAQ